jgi:hypothetical protein
MGFFFLIKEKGGIKQKKVFVPFSLKIQIKSGNKKFNF